ncbi:hypothetical protein DFH28DRAFT_1111983 [Melampsora americana]|nr:hypothetical protein DFH28DRAFT_1111983 [Melampsora americana]
MTSSFYHIETCMYISYVCGWLGLDVIALSITLLFPQNLKLDMFDPNISGVSKQAMLDWMHINRPMTPIKKNANKQEVAKKVREAQPDLFPDPSSEEPLVNCHSTASKVPHDAPESSSLTHESKVLQTDSKNKRSASPGTQSPQKKRVVSSKSSLSKSILRSKLQHGAPESGANRADGKVKKKKSVHYVEGLPHPESTDLRFMSTEASKEAQEYSNLRTARPEPVAASGGSGIVTQDEIKPLQKLRNSTESQHQQPTERSSTAPLINSNFASHATHKEALHEPLVALTPEHTTPGPGPYANDLIFFSDLDLFELENIVAGRDIPPIAPSTHVVRNTPMSLNTAISTNKSDSISSNQDTRSGVNVFQDERRVSLQLSTLEERMDSVEKRIVSFQDLQDRIANAEEDIQGARERIAWVEADIKTYKKSFEGIVEQHTKPIKEDFQQIRSVLDCSRAIS